MWMISGKFLSAFEYVILPQKIPQAKLTFDQFVLEHVKRSKGYDTETLYRYMFLTEIKLTFGMPRQIKTKETYYT